MKLFVFAGDRDTLTGLRLAGIDGMLIESEETLNEAVEALKARSDIAVLLVAQTVSLSYPAVVDMLKRDKAMLVSEIPDMAHPLGSADAITRYVKEVLGTKA